MWLTFVYFYVQEKRNRTGEYFHINTFSKMGKDVLPFGYKVVRSRCMTDVSMNSAYAGDCLK